MGAATGHRPSPGIGDPCGAAARTRRARRLPVVLLLTALAVLGGCGADPPAPAPPDGPTLRAGWAEGGVALRWAPRGAAPAAWRVQRRTCERCPWSTVRTLPGEARGWTDTDGLPGATLGHRVLGEQDDGPPTASPPVRTDVRANAELGFVSAAGLVTNGDVRLTDATAALRRLRTEGSATTVRADFGAAQLDEGRPRPFARLDRIAEAAARAGVDVIGIVQPRFDGPRPWAAVSYSPQATGRLATDPRVREAYARFAARLVARYGTRGTYWDEAARRGVPRRPITRWQIANEPWFDGFGISEGGARSFTDLVLQAAPAMRAADPARARILMPMADALTTSTYVRWARAAVSEGRAARLRGLVDAVTIHPYPFAVQENGRSLPPTMSRCVARETSQAQHGSSFCRVRSLRSDLVAADPGGLGQTPIWITELGLPTCAPPPGQRWTDGARCVSDAEQRRGVDEAFGLLRRWNAEPGDRALRLAGLVWFLDVDGFARDSEDPAARTALGYYGLFQRPDDGVFGGAAKPAWASWRREAARGIPAG